MPHGFPVGAGGAVVHRSTARRGRTLTKYAAGCLVSYRGSGWLRPAENISSNKLTGASETSILNTHTQINRILKKINRILKNNTEGNRMFSDNSFRATSTPGNSTRGFSPNSCRHVEKGTHSESFKKGTERHREVQITKRPRQHNPCPCYKQHNVTWKAPVHTKKLYMLIKPWKQWPKIAIKN